MNMAVTSPGLVCGTDLQVQRRLQDRGEDAEQRRVQELLGHGRRLLRPERVGAEPPRGGLVQPLHGRSRDTVAGDPGWPDWDDLVGDPGNLSQAASRQRRLMGGAEAASKCKSNARFMLRRKFWSARIV